MAAWDRDDLVEGYQLEIEEAKAGLRAYVSRNAAAWYLHVHPMTLSKMAGKGDGPARVTRSFAIGRNTRKFYELAELDAWKDARKNRSYAEWRGLGRLEALKAETRRLEIELEAKQVRALNARLRKKLRR